MARHKRSPRVAQTTHCAMGTVMSHQAFGLHAEGSLEAVCREIARLEGLLSRFLPGSDVSRLNRSAGIESVSVSLEAYDLLSQAVEWSRSLPGCFEVTIAPLVTLWSHGRESLVEPDAWSIRQALPLVSYADLILDPTATTAALRKAGQSVDLGGIGKGFAADRLVEVFRGFGISSAYSNLGGNVVTLGARPDGCPWQIGIQHPRQENSLLGAVSVVNETVVTSGDYQRAFTDRRGKTHHHILDPMTGYPAQSGLSGVTVVTHRSVAADPLATALFVAGLEKGLAFLSGQAGTEAIFVDTDVNVYITLGLSGRFQPADGVEVMILDYAKGEKTR